MLNLTGQKPLRPGVNLRERWRFGRDTGYRAIDVGAEGQAARAVAPYPGHAPVSDPDNRRLPGAGHLDRAGVPGTLADLGHQHRLPTGRATTTGSAA